MVFLCLNQISSYSRLGWCKQMIDNVKFADLLNQYLRNVLGCILMASSQVLSKAIGVCLHSHPPSRIINNIEFVRLSGSTPATPEARANFEVRLDAQAAYFHVWLMLARCINIVYILKVLSLSTSVFRQWVTINS